MTITALYDLVRRRGGVRGGALEPPHSVLIISLRRRTVAICRVVSVIARGFCKVTQRTASVICLTKTTGKKVGNGTACGSQRRAAVVQQTTESCCIFPHSLRVRQRRRRAGGIAVRCVMMKTTHIQDSAAERPQHHHHWQTPRSIDVSTTSSHPSLSSVLRHAVCTPKLSGLMFTSTVQSGGCQPYSSQRRFQ